MKLNSFMIFLISQTNCVPISADNKEAIECLNSSNAKKLRPGTGNHEIENGNIPKTAMETPRCGVSDKNIIGKRHKRYTLMSTKWPKTNLTWRFDHKDKEAFVKEEANIRRIIREASSVWEKDSIMKFNEKEEGDVDILISFEKPKHLEVDPYVFGSQTLGHAFQPGRGLGGDAHFNELILYDFDVSYGSNPEGGTVSFFTVAAHMLGHSIGLEHSPNRDSIMNERFWQAHSNLPEVDKENVQHIYGRPENIKRGIIKKTREEDEALDQIENPSLINKCTQRIDAIAMIDSEVVAFRRKYMFGPKSNATEIRSRWRGLPSKLTHVDAVFQTSDRKVLFFVNQDVYVLNGANLKRTYKLDDFGIDAKVPKIDAIFRKSDNNKIYIFFGNYYFIFDEHVLEVNQAKNEIAQSFKDVYDMTTAFTYINGITYFFKNQSFYEFDNKNQILNRMLPSSSAEFFLKCEPKEKIETTTKYRVQDFIVDI